MSKQDERIERALDEVSQQVAEIMRAAGVKQSDAYLCGDSAADAVKRLLTPEE